MQKNQKNSYNRFQEKLYCKEPYPTTGPGSKIILELSPMPETSTNWTEMILGNAGYIYIYIYVIP